MASPAAAPGARPRAPSLPTPSILRRCVGPRRPPRHLHHHRRPLLPPSATPAPGRRQDDDGDGAAEPTRGSPGDGTDGAGGAGGGAIRVAEAFIAYDAAAMAAEAGWVEEDGGGGGGSGAAAASEPALLLVDQPPDEEAPTGAVATLRSTLIHFLPALGSPDLLHRLGVTLAVVAAIRFGQAAPLAGFQALLGAGGGGGGAGGGSAAAAAAAAAAVAAATGGISVETAASGVAAGGSAAGAPAAPPAPLPAGDALAGADPPSAAASLLGLGLGPAINASWFFSLIQLAYIPGVLDPPVRRWLAALRGGGRAGEAEFGVVSKVVTAGFAAVAGWRTASALLPFAASAATATTSSFVLWTAAQLVAGALVTRWLADAVDEHGLGDGVSLLIAVSVVTGYARALRGVGRALLGAGWSGPTTAAAAGAIAAGSAALVAAAVWLSQVEARLPLVVYRRRRASPLQRLAAAAAATSGRAGGGGGGGGGVGAGASPWAAYAAWGAAAEAAGGGGGGGAAPAATPAATPAPPPPPPTAPPTLGAAPLVLGSADASYLPLRLLPSAMGPLLMASLATHLLPAALGLVAPAAGAALGRWLARPVVAPLATASLVLATEAAAAAGREGPRSMAEWMATAEVGLRGVPPGPDTEAVLAGTTRATRLAGAAALAGLSLAAAAFDACVARALGGAPAGSAALLLAAGFVASAQRQVAALVAGPRLERELAAERRAVRRLYCRS